MAKLSDRQILLTKSSNKDEFLNDGGGLYLRVRTSGHKIWLYRYKVENKTNWFDLGTYPSLSLKSARAEAARLSVDRRNGIDPLEQRIVEEKKQREEKAQKAARLTVTDLLNRWEKLELRNRKDKGAEVRRSFSKDVLPAIGDTPADDVKRAMIAQILDAVVARGSPIIARNLLGDMRQMFGFAIVRGLVEHDPTSRLKRDDFGKKMERDRILSEAELRVIATKMIDARMSASSIASIWIMLSTCCRVGEISRARWGDIDLEAATWRIPPENSKNAKAHMIYLSPFAIRNFKELQKLAGDSPWVLPARWESKSKAGHVCMKSLAKQIGDRQRSDKKPMKCRSLKISALVLPGGRWTPHDLRRTGATIMGNLGVRPDVIEKCLNHVEQNRLVRIYQRQKLESEQRAAWVLLGKYLERVISEQTVIFNDAKSKVRTLNSLVRTPVALISCDGTH